MDNGISGIRSVTEYKTNRDGRLISKENLSLQAISKF